MMVKPCWRGGCFSPCVSRISLRDYYRDKLTPRPVDMTGDFPQFRIGNGYENTPMISPNPSDTNDSEDEDKS